MGACIPVLGWEKSGRAFMRVEAGDVYRLLARRSAGPAWPYGGVRQLGVRVQAQGRHVRGSDGTGGTWSDWTPSIRHLFEYRHQVDEARQGLGGALRGRSPRTREGRLGPTAQDCSGQWSVVSGQWSETVFPLSQSRSWNGDDPVAAREKHMLTPVLGRIPVGGCIPDLGWG